MAGGVQTGSPSSEQECRHYSSRGGHICPRVVLYILYSVNAHIIAFHLAVVLFHL